MSGFDEYAVVGPALFVMHNHPELAAQVHHYPSGTPEPEVWIAIHKTWVRFDGQWISGWRGDTHFGFRPSLLNRWKIRRASRAWRAASVDGRGMAETRSGSVRSTTSAVRDSGDAQTPSSTGAGQ